MNNTNGMYNYAIFLRNTFTSKLRLNPMKSTIFLKIGWSSNMTSQPKNQAIKKLPLLCVPFAKRLNYSTEIICCIAIVDFSKCCLFVLLLVLLSLKSFNLVALTFRIFQYFTSFFSIRFVVTFETHVIIIWN